MPKEAKDNSVPGIATGVAFYYLDANKKGALLPSSKTLDDKDQAIAYTLNQFYSKQKDPDVMHIMYNDEPYNSTSSASLLDMLLSNRAETIQFGHTKATQLYFNKPDIYASQLPIKMASDIPQLAQQGEPYTSTVTLTTKGGANFISFAKTNQFNNDLYDGLVAQALKADLIAETWRRGSEVPLGCSLTYHTNDALTIQVGATQEFKYTKDHSKIARSTDPSKPWVCIGDVNRMTSQYIRGGGTECFSSTFVWQAFNVIKDENMC
ncbi:hypothetical protein GCK32_012025 [Trichostrongylus colubriformis]|uniref:Uncharacterized protein n=1 Tax=Trichostrongylus colubriformis TaxID=6319 RepID=A0AAN8ETZ5_TRICO